LRNDDDDDDDDDKIRWTHRTFWFDKSV
jgi:hypothetical protein